MVPSPNAENRYNYSTHLLGIPTSYADCDYKGILHLIDGTRFKNKVVLEELLHILIYSELRDLEPGY